MLRYLAIGQRRFGLYPMPVQERVNWEMYAALEGSIGATTKAQPNPPIVSSHLWVFPPETAHGWVGEKNRPAIVVCFHFGMIPQILEELAHKKGHLAIALSEKQTQHLRVLAEELMPHFLSPTAYSPLFFEKALLDLALIALSHTQDVPSPQADISSAEKVEVSLAWFEKHLQEQPKLKQVAEAVGVCESHLRRLFWKWRKQSPHQAFIEIKMRHSLTLMSQSDLKLDAVAHECGFSSAIDFCRSFKARFHVSPTSWKKTQLLPYDEERHKQELRAARDASA